MGFPFGPTSKSTTLSASGTGQVKVGPFNPRQRWHVTRATVQVSSATAEPTATLYLGSVGGGRLGGTYTGSNDMTDLDVWLSNSATILCVWTGGDAGATATLTLEGTQE